MNKIEHQSRMTKRKAERDRRPEPDMNQKRAWMLLSAWSASEYVKVRGVGQKNLMKFRARPLGETNVEA